MLLKLFIFTKRRIAAPLKENKTFSCKNNRGFVDSEFVKTCHEQVRRYEQFKKKLMFYSTSPTLKICLIQSKSGIVSSSSVPDSS
jgi:hypothetical protein